MFQWPEGKTSAAAFTFDVDAESAVLWNAPGTADRMSVMSHQAYGPLVGVPRLLGLLEHHQIRSTFFVPGFTAHRYPATVRDIVAAGHEIAHHGYLHEMPSALSLEEQIANLDRGLEALQEVAGVRPVGYRAPMWDLSWQSPALLAERGFLYDSSLMDADAPYELAVAPGLAGSGAGMAGSSGSVGLSGAGSPAAGSSGSPQSIVEIPLHWALDDWEQYCYLPDISGSGVIATPAHARELWTSEFEALTDAGGCWVLTNHPFLSGRPGRARALGELMAEVVSTPGVWTTTLEEIARHTRSLGLTPRSIEKPQLS